MASSQRARPTREDYVVWPYIDEFDVNLVDRFLGKIIRLGDCWIFPCGRDVYGSLFSHGKAIRVHRLSYLLAHGAIGENEDIIHTCGELRCINPAHLSAVNRTNRFRAVNEARHERKPIQRARPLSAKLSESDVIDIRRRAMSGEALTDIAREKGVPTSAVGLVVHSATWVDTEGGRTEAPKLNWADVKRMRALHLKGYGLHKLAVLFRVPMGIVTLIVNDERWKHIENGGD